MQVFISYSRSDSDTPVARYLAAVLEASGFTVWLDQYSLPAGVPLESAIEQAIAASDCAIFIVSKMSLQHRWCRFELDRAVGRGEALRRVPILRLPYGQLKLPMGLFDLTAIVWQEDDPHQSARLWEVYCAITSGHPGDPATWQTEGEKIQKGHVPPTIVHPVAPTAESLRCNRAAQWSRVIDLAPERSHDLMFVPGPIGQAHEHFSRRVREMLTTLPPRSIVPVQWKKRPVSRDEYLSVLAGSLGVSVPALAGEMANRMADENLVLIHQCIGARYIDSALISYYTEWLPAVLNDVKPRMSLKCIQPVAWVPGPTGVDGMLTWLRLKRPSSYEGKPEAEQLIGAIRRSAALRTIRLQELSDVTDSDLDEFCQVQNLSSAQTAWFLAALRARNPKNAEELFGRIDELLPDARRDT